MYNAFKIQSCWINLAHCNTLHMLRLQLHRKVFRTTLFFKKIYENLSLHGPWFSLNGWSPRLNTNRGWLGSQIFRTFTNNTWGHRIGKFFSSCPKCTIQTVCSHTPTFFQTLAFTKMQSSVRSFPLRSQETLQSR